MLGGGLDVDTLANELSESARADAQDSGVTFRLEVSQDLAHIRLDRAQLRHAVLERVHDALHGLAFGQVEARELVARIELNSAHEIEVCVDLRR
ncbi:MAG: hypothetical protein JWL65_7226 [Gammaproteobacteria bacterium]|jgi:hypothetical protein|nr:hypothetical protein [Gammaproteobacteria bacterium]